MDSRILSEENSKELIYKITMGHSSEFMLPSARGGMRKHVYYVCFMPDFTVKQ